MTATSTQWEEARDTAKHPTMHRPAPDKKELSIRKCQEGQGQEISIRVSETVHSAIAFRRRVPGEQNKAPG